MTIHVLCPNGHSLAVEDQYAGKLVRCGQCSAVLTVPDPPTAAVAVIPLARVVEQPVQPLIVLSLDEPAEAPEEVPIKLAGNEAPAATGAARRSSRAGKRDQIGSGKGMTSSDRMQRVGLGLGFHYAKLLCLLGAIALTVCVVVVAMMIVAFHAQDRTAPPPAGARGLAVLALVALLLVTAATVCGVLGSLFCCWAPRKSQARVYSLISLVLESAGVLFTLFSFLFTLRSPAEGEVLSRLATLMSFAGWIFFMVFLRVLAYYLHDRGTADEVLRLLILAIILSVGGPVILVVLALAFAKIPLTGVFVLLGGATLWLACYVKIMMGILNAIAYLRQEIATRW